MTGDDDDDQHLQTLGMAMRLEFDRKRAEIELADEADPVIDALEAGRPVILDGWGSDEYLADLKERIDAAVAFPATPWWK